MFSYALLWPVPTALIVQALCSLHLPFRFYSLAWDCSTVFISFPRAPIYFRAWLRLLGSFPSSPAFWEPSPPVLGTSPALSPVITPLSLIVVIRLGSVGSYRLTPTLRKPSPCLYLYSHILVDYFRYCLSSSTHIFTSLAVSGSFPSSPSIVEPRPSVCLWLLIDPRFTPLSHLSIWHLFLIHIIPLWGLIGSSPSSPPFWELPLSASSFILVIYFFMGFLVPFFTLALSGSLGSSSSPLLWKSTLSRSTWSLDCFFGWVTVLFSSHRYHRQLN